MAPKVKRTVVKRTYDGSRRKAQARATRRSIVEAAYRLFVERGYAGTTIDAIADEAGVAPQTVYGGFGGKIAILKEVIDQALVGDDEPVPLIEREEIRRAFQQPHPEAFLRLVAVMAVGVSRRFAPLAPAVEAAAQADDEIRAMRAGSFDYRRQDAHAVAVELAKRKGVRTDLSIDDITDRLFALMGNETYGLCVLGAGWSEERYEAFIADTWIRTLLA